MSKNHLINIFKQSSLDLSSHSKFHSSGGTQGIYPWLINLVQVAGSKHITLTCLCFLFGKKLQNFLQQQNRQLQIPFKDPLELTFINLTFEAPVVCVMIKLMKT